MTARDDVDPQGATRVGSSDWVRNHLSALPPGAGWGEHAAGRELLHWLSAVVRHRAGGFGLRPPEVIALRPGGFAEWMRRRGRLGSQNKVPRVIADLALFADLRAFTEANRQSDEVS